MSRKAQGLPHFWTKPEVDDESVQGSNRSSLLSLHGLSQIRRS